MEKTKRREFMYRLLCLTLAALVGISFVPFIEGSAYAAALNGAEDAQTFEVMEDGSEAGDAAPDDVDITEPAEADGDVEYVDADDISETVMIGSLSEGLANAGLFGLSKGGVGIQEASIEELPAGTYSVESSKKGNIITYTGTINAPYKFGSMYLDGPNIKLGTINSSSINYSIDMSYFDVGYHTVILEVLDQSSGSLIDYIGEPYIAVNPTIKPDSKGSIEAYSTYIRFWPYSFGTNDDARLYMEYKPVKAKTWKRSGYMESNMIVSYYDQIYKISGFKPNKKYSTRIRYGVSAEYNYDNKTYTFYGPTLSTGSFKTGAKKKPKIKSVRAKAVSVKYHKVRHYGPYTGVYLYTEKFYTCKVKVTIKLKKKPGAKGLEVSLANGGTKYLKGNKKTYTTTFTIYPNYFFKRPNKSGSKYTVSFRSYQSKKYGGYSPMYSKAKKLS